MGANLPSAPASPWVPTGNIEMNPAPMSMLACGPLGAFASVCNTLCGGMCASKAPGAGLPGLSLRSPSLCSGALRCSVLWPVAQLPPLAALAVVEQVQRVRARSALRARPQALALQAAPGREARSFARHTRSPGPLVSLLTFSAAQFAPAAQRPSPCGRYRARRIGSGQAPKRALVFRKRPRVAIGTAAFHASRLAHRFLDH